MTTSRRDMLWTLTTIVLILIIIAGGLIIWLRYNGSQPVEISISPPGQEQLGYIYIDGAVTTPGLYPFRTGDSIDTLMQAAGGVTNGADLSRLKLHIPTISEEGPQKVNINTAEAWLLEALPEIGNVKAQAIVNYRRQNGLFHNTTELTMVEGIGITTYEKIKDLIVVAD